MTFDLTGIWQYELCTVPYSADSMAWIRHYARLVSLFLSYLGGNITKPIGILTAFTPFLASICLCLSLRGHLFYFILLDLLDPNSRNNCHATCCFCSNWLELVECPPHAPGHLYIVVICCFRVDSFSFLLFRKKKLGSSWVLFFIHHFSSIKFLRIFIREKQFRLYPILDDIKLNIVIFVCQV